MSGSSLQNDGVH